MMLTAHHERLKTVYQSENKNTIYPADRKESRNILRNLSDPDFSPASPGGHFRPGQAYKSAAFPSEMNGRNRLWTLSWIFGN